MSSACWVSSAVPSAAPDSQQCAFCDTPQKREIIVIGGLQRCGAELPGTDEFQISAFAAARSAGPQRRSTARLRLVMPGPGAQALGNPVERRIEVDECGVIWLAGVAEADLQEPEPGEFLVSVGEPGDNCHQAVLSGENEQPVLVASVGNPDRLGAELHAAIRSFLSCR